MTSQFESIMTGIAGHIGNYADAIRIPAGVELIHTSGTRDCALTAPCPRTSAKKPRKLGAMSRERLARAGATLGDIVSVRQWLTDATDIPAYAAVRSLVITHPPAFMLGVIPALVWPNIRVEIEGTAARPAV
jgi:2-iminobutanoate/2-iminopropanoate deaminase